MEYQDKLNILEAVLKKNGLSLQDEKVHNFFYRDRRCFLQNEYNDDGKKYTHSSYMKPVMKNISPLDFENSGYFTEYRTLIDWFMYENSSSNPLVWNNIGNPTFDVLESYERTREFMGPIRQSLEGKLYNGEDANHRLLTLIINQFIETNKAQNEELKQSILEKYTMQLEVSLPIKYELNRLLLDEMDKFRQGRDVKSVYPALVREYRIKNYEHYREAFYCISFDEQTKLHTYNFNGEKFVGTEDELIEWIRNKEQQKDPIMTWEAQGVYYISCNNKILKSKSKEKIDQVGKNMKKWLSDGKMDFCDFLEIKDLDSNLYEIQFPSAYIEDKKEAEYYADAVKYLLTENKEVLERKLENVDFTIDCLQDNIDKAFSYWGGYSMPDLIYKNLTKEEFDKLKPIMLELGQAMEYAKNPELANV